MHAGAENSKNKFLAWRLSQWQPASTSTRAAPDLAEACDHTGRQLKAATANGRHCSIATLLR
jgi:hypothetical protein